MPIIDAHPHGSFCWIELETNDARAAGSFYSGLFGWEVVPRRDGERTYCFRVRGREVAAMSVRERGEAEWMSYVAVDDLERTVDAAEKLGARVIAKPAAPVNGGHIAAIAAPDRAVVGLRQSAGHHGIGIRDEVNTLCWNELMTRDVEAAKRFYRTIFGWRPADSGDYTEWRAGENAVGGMLPVNSQNVTPRWLPYFAVADFDRAFSDITSLGGALLTDPQEIAGVGRFAVAEDPQHGSFAVIGLVM